MTAMLSRLHIPYELFASVNGRSMSVAEMEQRVDMRQVRKFPWWLTTGMLEATVSHLEVCLMIACGEDEVVLGDYNNCVRR